MIETDLIDSTLFLACRQGNASEIKKIAESRGIARRVDLSMQDASGQTADDIGPFERRQSMLSISRGVINPPQSPPNTECRLLP